MVTEQELFSLAMTTVTQDDVLDLRAEFRDLRDNGIAQLRQVVETLRSSNEGLRTALGEAGQRIEGLPTRVDLLDHVQRMDRKMKDDLAKCQKQISRGPDAVGQAAIATHQRPGLDRKESAYGQKRWSAPNPDKPR